jgi:hypothetical protein
MSNNCSGSGGIKRKRVSATREGDCGTDDISKNPRCSSGGSIRGSDERPGDMMIRMVQTVKSEIHEDENFLHQLGRLEFTQSTLLQLIKGKGWVKDNVIEWYFSRLSASSNKSTKTTVMMDPQIMIALTGYCPSSMQTEDKKGSKFKYPYRVKSICNGKGFDISTADEIFIPVNINDYHWALIVVYMDTKRLVYYDSKGGNGVYSANDGTQGR